MAEKEATKPVTQYTKGQILASKRYQDIRDLLNALLREDKKYSHVEIEKAVRDFSKKKVD